MLQKDRLSSLELDNRAAEAKALIDNPLLNELFDGMRANYIATLMAEEVGSSRSNVAQAGLQGLEGIISGLKKPINDQKMHQNRNFGRE